MVMFLGIGLRFQLKFQSLFCDTLDSSSILDVLSIFKIKLVLITVLKYMSYSTFKTKVGETENMAPYCPKDWESDLKYEYEFHVLTEFLRLNYLRVSSRVDHPSAFRGNCFSPS